MQVSPNLIAQKYNLPPLANIRAWIDEIIHFAVNRGNVDVPIGAIEELRKTLWKLTGFASECKIDVETVLLMRRFQVLVEQIELICMGAVTPPDENDYQELVADFLNTYRSIILHAFDHIPEER